MMACIQIRMVLHITLLILALDIGPMNFQIIKYTDGSSTPYLNAEKVLSKSDLKKIEKDKKKEENKKNNKGFLNSNPFLIFLGLAQHYWRVILNLEVPPYWQ